MRFGRKKKKSKQQEAQGEQKKDKKNKKSGKNRKSAAVVSTPVQSQRARTRSSLRRRASVQRTSGEPRPKYVVDAQLNRLVQLTPQPQDGDSETGESFRIKPHASSAETMNDRSGSKPILRQPSSSRTPSPRQPDPPTPPPPPPLWTIPRPTSMQPQPDGPYPLSPTHMAKARSLEDLLAPPQPHEDLAPRPRQASDIRKWVRWRTDVNQKLSSFMMDPADTKGTDILPDAFPKLKSMRNETLNAILFHAYDDDSTQTSLDKLSYMIYGIPRIEGLYGRKSKSMDDLSLVGEDELGNLQQTPSPDYTTREKIVAANDGFYGYEEPVRQQGNRMVRSPDLKSASPETRLHALTRGDGYFRPDSRQRNHGNSDHSNIYDYDRTISPMFGTPPPSRQAPNSRYPTSPASPRLAVRQSYTPNSRPESSVDLHGHPARPPVPGGVPTLLSGLALRGHLPTPPKAEVTAQGTHAHGGYFRQTVSPPPLPPSRSGRHRNQAPEGPVAYYASGSPRRY